MMKKNLLLCALVVGTMISAGSTLIGNSSGHSSWGHLDTADDVVSFYSSFDIFPGAFAAAGSGASRMPDLPRGDESENASYDALGTFLFLGNKNEKLGRGTKLLGGDFDTMLYAYRDQNGYCLRAMHNTFREESASGICDITSLCKDGEKPELKKSLEKIFLCIKKYVKIEDQKRVFSRVIFHMKYLLDSDLLVSFTLAKKEFISIFDAFLCALFGSGNYSSHGRAPTALEKEFRGMVGGIVDIFHEHYSARKYKSAHACIGYGTGTMGKPHAISELVHEKLEEFIFQKIGLWTVVHLPCEGDSIRPAGEHYYAAEMALIVFLEVLVCMFPPLS